MIISQNGLETGPCDARPGLTTDIHLALRGATNLLLIGPAVACDDVIGRVRPALSTPLAAWRTPAPLLLPPPSTVATVILHGIDALTRPDQHRLLDWSGAAAHVKVISTAEASLLAHIGQGTFLDALYYRLNTVTIRLPAAGAATTYE